jgi:hypothetical protein
MKRRGKREKQKKKTKPACTRKRWGKGSKKKNSALSSL